jgi:hypothetical protein
MSLLDKIKGWFSGRAVQRDEDERVVAWEPGKDREEEAQTPEAPPDSPTDRP